MKNFIKVLEVLIASGNCLVFQPPVNAAQPVKTGVFAEDTLNKLEKNSIKEGPWIYFGNMTDLPGYAPEQIVEEGRYHNNLREGVWAKYFPNGKKLSDITFSKDRPDGEYRIYYENGIIQEYGVWNNNRNTKNLRRFYKNGQIRHEFYFNESGKRDGIQKYYHPNGKLHIVGLFRGGKELGEFQEFRANGNLKSLKVFIKPGILSISKSMEFEPDRHEREDRDMETEKSNKPAPYVEKSEKPNEASAKFYGEGYHILYNRNRQITLKGYFEKGRLKDGSKYVYNADGILITIEEYRDFRFVGEAAHE